MKCKFCGCTENRPCQIPIDIEGQFIPGARVDGIAVPLLTAGFAACGWLIENSVCTAPACVEKAYLEAWPLADDLAA